MRCYSIATFYLSSIQQGIQGWHSCMEIMNKYDDNKELLKQKNIFKEWSRNHKTVVCLDGGKVSNLKEIKELFEAKENPFPFAHFNESEEALDGSLTSLAIVLPEYIYEGMDFFRKNKGFVTVEENFYLVDKNLIEEAQKDLSLNLSFGSMIIESNLQPYSEFECALIQKLAPLNLAK